MCCDGTLFECLELDPDERSPFAKNPFVVVSETVATKLPCCMHVGGECTVYENRPSRCRKFTCRLYEAVEDGASSVFEAQTRIQELKGLFNAIESALGWASGSFSTTRFRAWAADFPGGEAMARQTHPSAFLKYGLSRILMDRHFIPPRAKNQ